MSEHDTPTPWPPRRLSACQCQQCGQGDRACQTPEACEISVEELPRWQAALFDALDRLTLRKFWLGYAAFLVCAVVFVHVVTGWAA